jgi:cyanobactin maturation PatA/PatG family protease
MTDAVDISSHLPELKSIWQESIGESNIMVALLDGPVDLSHPCFEGTELTHLETLISSDPNNEPSSQHGTNVASIIFGQHGSLVRGISPGCHGLIVPIFSEGPDGSLSSCSQIDLAHAITQSLEYGAKVINISGGKIDSSGKPHPLLASTLRLCAENGVLIVAAAGNDGCQCLHVPAAIPSTLAVGAMDSRGSPLEFSNWGDAYRTNGILAPGEHIRLAVPGGGVAAKNGTSFASAIISGIVALLLSIQIKQGDKPDPYAVRDAILESAHSCPNSDSIDCRRYLAGSLNVAAAYDIIAKKEKRVMDNNNSAKQVLENKRRVLVDSLSRSPVTGLQSAEVSTSGPDPTKKSLQRLSPDRMNALEKVVSIAEMCDTETRKQKEEDDVMVEMVAETCGCMTKQEDAEKMAEQTEETSGLSEATRTQMPTSAVKAAESLVGTHSIIDKKSSVMSEQVQPSQVGGSTSLVYALGTLNFDFGTEARRDAFVQSMEGDQPNPNDPFQLLDHLKKNPEYSASLIWTLDIEATPVYAIRPAGPYSPRAYDKLREFLKAQQTEGVERVSIPGYLVGQTKLLSGQMVPVIIPEVRGMFSWSTDALVRAVIGQVPEGADNKALKIFSVKESGIRNFSERVYYELMNLGRASQERAMNFAGTNAFQVAAVFEQAARENLVLDSIDTERSPICRPDSDCWDVKLTFFDPANRLTVARKVYRFTVDVSDVVPVTIGKVRSWSVY